MCQIHTTKTFADCKHKRATISSCSRPDCKLPCTQSLTEALPGLCNRCTRKSQNPDGLNIPHTFEEVDLTDLIRLAGVVLFFVVVGVQILGIYRQHYMEKRYQPVIEVLDELAEALGANVRFRKGKWVEWV